MEPSTYLSAIFWKEAAKDRSILQGWRFLDDPVHGGEIPFEKEVGDLAETDYGRIVYLVQSS